MDGWSALLRSVRFGGLAASDGSWGYQFTPDDLRLAVPMLAGESRDVYDEFAQLCTMANRLYWTRDMRVVRKDGYVLPMPHTFADLILAYSSVINPYFREHGGPSVVARRAELLNAPPSYFNPHTVSLAVEFMTGQLYAVEAFQGLVHFAECDYGRAKHGEPTMKIKNCFWRASGWPSGLLIVPVPPRIEKHPFAPLVFGAVAAGLGLAAWKAWS